MAGRRAGCPCRETPLASAYNPFATAFLRPDPTPTGDYPPSLRSPWRAERNKTRYPQNAPLTFHYRCEPFQSASWDNAVDRDGLNTCRAFYGLPPFKLYEIPRGKKRPHGMHYIFYSDALYGPMNREAPVSGPFRETQPYLLSSGAFLQNLLNDDSGRLNVVFAPAINEGFRPNYNSLIRYRNEYYYFILNQPYNAYWVGIDNVNDKNVCRWYAQKSRTSGE